MQTYTQLDFESAWTHAGDDLAEKIGKDAYDFATHNPTKKIYKTNRRYIHELIANRALETLKRYMLKINVFMDFEKADDSGYGHAVFELSW